MGDATLTFLTGGARSGKSRLAVERAARWAGPVAVVVTGQARDEEMSARIEHHRATRPSHWDVVEAPIELEAALDALADGTFAIVDCLTLWVSNLLEAGAADDAIDSLARSAAARASAHDGPVVVVTNEVGSGIVPVNELARRYRDVLGRVNALWCAASDDAFLVVAGRTIRLEAVDAG